MLANHKMAYIEGYNHQNDQLSFLKNLFLIYPFTLSYVLIDPDTERKGNVLFNDALNTFYLRLYGVRHMVKDHSGSDSKGYFTFTIPQTG